MTQVEPLMQTADAVENYAEKHLFHGSGLMLSAIQEARFDGRDAIYCRVT